jgi:predicted Zn-dependent protease
MGVLGWWVAGAIAGTRGTLAPVDAEAKRGGRGMRLLVAPLLSISLCITPLPLAAKNKKKNADTENIGRRDVNRGSWNLYSPEREIELGRQLARNAERTLPLLRDPLVVNYVSEIAERIVRHSDSRTPLLVRVVDSSEVNAYALPGGFFFINTGLILESQTEAELASVIAHEVAHVAARHATKQMTKLQIWNWLSLPLLFFGGPVAYTIQQSAALVVPLTFLKFSRNAEREADFLGLQYHYASGYDPTAFVDFFERVKRKEKDRKGGIARAFSTHPMTSDRIVAAERTIEQYLPPRDEYVVTTSRHGEIQAYLESLASQPVERRDAERPVLRRRDVRDRTSRKDPTNPPF